jgi:hypothetical protein
MTLLDICQSLEASSVGTLVRESTWGFQIIVAFHLTGLVASVGTVCWFDLRLTGVSMTGNRISDVYRRLAPLMLAGFAVMFITGGMLFVGYASKAVDNPYFRLKLLAIAGAGANALVYHLVTEKRRGEWDSAPHPPFGARLAGGISLSLWLLVILCGRLISYTMF